MTCRLNAPVMTVMVTLAFVTTRIHADWPGWRNTDGNGVSDEKNLPGEWAEGKNIRWSLELPEWGNSSPCVVGDRIYLTTQLKDNSLHVIAIDRVAGKILWKRKVGTGTRKHHVLHNMATPTCVAEPRRVWALFGTGDLYCLDRTGRILWSRNLEKDHGEYKILWAMASSPRLHGDQIFLACMNGGPSYVLALDKTTGDDSWKTAREYDCVGEGYDSYSTPLLSDVGGKVELVVAGADHVDAYDLASGKRRWVSGGLKSSHPYGRTIASPTSSDGMVLAVSCGYAGQGLVLALEIDKDAKGDVTESHRRWVYSKHAPDCPSPVSFEGLVYLIRDNGVASCIDAKSGVVKWRERLTRSDCKASPVAADGKVYFTSVKGDVIVLKAGPKREVIAHNRVTGTVIATPAISDETIYVRSRTHLWAFGKKRG